MNRNCSNSLNRVALAALLAVCFSVNVQGAGAQVSTLKAGFAERDITPVLGMEKPGGYGKSYHRAFHDPCKIRAAVFDDGKKIVALVGTDTLVIPRQVVVGARAEIAKRCNIPAEAVMIGASHSHSSGPVGMVLPGQFDHASEFVQDLAYNKSSMADAAYLDRVQKAVADGVYDAWRTRREAKAGFGSGTEDKVSFNRRHFMKGHVTYTHPKFGNPDMLGYAGPIDPEVGVIGAWDSEGQLMGVVVNFACHATTSPAGVSANWIYYLEQTIQGAMHARVPVVFLQGASGDVTQVNNFSPSRNPSGGEWAKLVGGRIGAEAVKVLLSMTPGSEIPVDHKLKTLKLRRRVPSDERVKKSTEIAKKPISEVGSTAWLFAKEALLLKAMIQTEGVVDAEVQAIQVGPAVFLSNPAEFFCQLGLDIKAGSKFQFTYPVELANGCVGYVPTVEAMGPGGGGYETRISSYTNLEIQAGPKMVDAAVDLANSMKPGEAPSKAPAGKFTAPWSYGATPPEVK